MEIDHINGIKDDNRISNLRLATRMQNSMNVAINHRNTSGVMGVAWDAGRSRWIASVSANGETFNIGRLKSIHAAERAVINARNKTNGEFSNHGESKMKSPRPYQQEAITSTIEEIKKYAKQGKSAHPDY